KPPGRGASDPQYAAAPPGGHEPQGLQRGLRLCEEAGGVMKDTVLIIGGGIAGVQAALDLAEAGSKVVLVEKSPTI
ncbi:MAG: FAD-dependent oxidoreductase, partial [Anaerolineae bacterium]|nr:FAD-dependent oxidoreductase [Anaerolineae bacterium]NIN98496.1 FAD-dependent oxidoreductase [Anaerolineae bacterium]